MSLLSPAFSMLVLQVVCAAWHMAFVQQTGLDMTAACSDSYCPCATTCGLVAACNKVTLTTSSHLFWMHQGLREKLTNPEAANAARLSKKLVTIHTDIVLPPVRFPMDHLALQTPSDLTRAAVKAAFASLEFAQHEKRLEAIWDNMARSQAALSGRPGAQGWHSAIKPASEFITSQLSG